MKYKVGTDIHKQKFYTRNPKILLFILQLLALVTLLLLLLWVFGIGYLPSDCIGGVCV